MQPPGLLVSGRLQDRRQTLRWRPDFLTLAILFLSMSSLYLMPLEVYSAAIVFHGSDELRQMRFRGLALMAFGTQKASALANHGSKPSAPDILSRDGARHGPIDALHRPVAIAVRFQNAFAPDRRIAAA